MQMLEALFKWGIDRMQMNCKVVALVAFGVVALGASVGSNLRAVGYFCPSWPSAPLPAFASVCRRRVR
jgi:hypothetical protein